MHSVYKFILVSDSLVRGQIRLECSAAVRTISELSTVHLIPDQLYILH